jgi:hypothetical protein
MDQDASDGYDSKRWTAFAPANAAIAGHGLALTVIEFAPGGRRSKARIGAAPQPGRALTMGVP